MSAIAGPGTTEAAWLPFLEGLRLPPLKLTPPPRRVVVLAPHPDDEVLGVGGLLALLSRAGASVEVVAVTDGEASHPASTAVPPTELSLVRTMETVTALTALGLRPTVHRLGLRDGGAGSLEDPVTDALASDDELLQPGDWLLAPWDSDGHPDHEAVGRAAHRVVERTGARLLAYPVWAWHWAQPADPRVPWSRASVVRLPADVRRAKAAAVTAFRSQTEPLGPDPADPADAAVLPAAVLARFARPYEVVFG